MSNGSTIIGFWTFQVDILTDRNITSFLARSMRVTSSRCMTTIVMRMVPKDSDIRHIAVRYTCRAKGIVAERGRGLARLTGTVL